MIYILASVMVTIGIPVVILVVLARTGAQLRQLKRRVERLEYFASRPQGPPPVGQSLTPATPPAPPAADAPGAPAPPPTPAPAAPVPAIASVLAAVPDHAARPESVESPSRRPSTTSLELLVGGVWLQNIGSVL